MADKAYIYEPSVGEQNADNTVFNYAKIYDATNNAAVTGNTYKYKSDRERMQALIGTKGLSRTSGYFDGLLVRFYPITVTSPTLPSINGPGNPGWGSEIVSPLAVNSILFDNNFFINKCNLQFYVGISARGYIYSPVATTAQFRTTSDDGSVVYFNGTNVVNNWAYQGDTTVTSAVVNVFAGYNPITIYFFNGTLTATLNFQVKIGNGGFTNNLKCLCYYNYSQL